MPTPSFRWRKAPNDVPAPAVPAPAVPAPHRPASELPREHLAALATGVGSLPGTDIDEACRIVAGELSELPHVPELPGRGAGADLTGRTAALLVGLHVDLQPAGWRLVSRPSFDGVRAKALLQRDLDALELALHGFRGVVKIQAAGPLTLAATLERERGEKALADHGARRDLAHSLAEGLALHRTEILRRLPGCDVVVQIDEPALPVVLAGAVPTASGFSRLRAVHEPEALDVLHAVLAAAGPDPVLHCCAPAVPFALLRRAGAVGLSFDLAQIREADLTALGEAVDAGCGLWIGAVRTLDPPRTMSPPSDAAIRGRVARLWGRIGFDEATARHHTVITPACGLAGASPAWARRAYALCVAVARSL